MSEPRRAPYISTGQLPPSGKVQEIIDDAWGQFRHNRDGQVADYIPALASVAPDLFGICVANTSGEVHAIGDAEIEFSIQSVSKPFVFALICQAIGVESAKEKLGVNASGLSFNSVMAIELNPSRTVNPLVNAGAIATTSLAPGGSERERWDFIRMGLSRFAGRDLQLNEEIYASEASSNHRNQSLAWLLDSYGHMYSDPVEATDLYTRQCSLNVTAIDLAVMGATLANAGVNPNTHERVIDAEIAPRVLAVMATAGLYETSGDWLFDTGLPAKSGVGGGIVTISPGKGGLGTFAPRLDAAGNSIKGQLVARAVSEELGFNLFASQRGDE